jgi:anti-anti-sigma factor
MEITREKSGTLLVLRLAGRLDANWCNHVQNALAAAVRDGEHQIHLDMAEVGYVSSAGLRVLLSFYKQLRAINGLFGVARASAAVRDVLELAGLAMLIAADANASAPAGEEGRPFTSSSARYELFDEGAPSAGVRIEARGDPAVLRCGAEPAGVSATEFGANAFALGVGALGQSYVDCASRCGEFLAVAGVAAFQPADGSSRPDFIVSQGALVPKGRLLLGLFGEGEFPLLARFEATAEERTIGFTELAHTALELSGAHTAAFVAVTETSGLIGASLRQSPAFAEPSAGRPASADVERFGFPQIRDWLSFTSERAFRDSTSMLVGVVSKPGSPFDSLLRPLGTAAAEPKAAKPRLMAHVHAAAFPYRPLRKGRIEVKTSINELFEGHALQAVLHLLADPRIFNGAGESEFFRGALWIAPVQTS